EPSPEATPPALDASPSRSVEVGPKNPTQSEQSPDPSVEPAATPTATQTRFTNVFNGTVGQEQGFWIGITPAPAGGKTELRIGGEMVSSAVLQAGQTSVALTWTPLAAGTFSAQAVFGG